MKITGLNILLLTGVLAVLITLGFVSSLYSKKARTMEHRFNQEEQRADSLLSVKFQLEGDVRSLNSQLELATDENESSGRHISTIHDQFNQRDALEKRLRQQAMGKNRTITGLNQNRVVLRTTRDSLENQLAAMNDKIIWMKDENELLLSLTKTLKQQINDLTATLSGRVSRLAVTGNNFLVESVKTNRKETAKAKKVKFLTISLDVPAEL